ncbi:MAG: hypothetical protein DRJ03_26610, partial [Chloroflexi bacterium]
MNEATQRGPSGWDKADLSAIVGERGSETSKAVWKKMPEDVISAASIAKIDPLLLLAKVNSPNITPQELVDTAHSLASGVQASGGSLRGTVASGMVAPEEYDRWMNKAGEVYKPEVAKEQQRVLPEYMSLRQQPVHSLDPHGRLNSGELNNPATGQRDPYEPSYLPTSDNPWNYGHFAQVLGDDRSYRDIQYAQSVNTKLAPEMPEEDSRAKEILQDNWNAFLVGMSTNVTETATMIGALAGVDELTNWGIGASEHMEERFKVENPNWFTALSAGLGSMLPAAAGGLWTRAITVSVGRRLLKKIVLDQIAKKKLLQQVGRAGFTIGMATPEALAQSGNTYRQALGLGATEDEAFTAARNDMVRNIGVLGVSDYVLGAGYGTSLVKVLRNALARGISEGTQEIAQGISQRWAIQDYTEEDFNLFDYDQITEGTVGFVLGAVVGTGMARFNKNAEIQEEAIREIEQRLGLKKGTTAGIQREVLDKQQEGGIALSPEDHSRMIELHVSADHLVQK